MPVPQSHNFMLVAEIDITNLLIQVETKLYIPIIVESEVEYNDLCSMLFHIIRMLVE